MRNQTWLSELISNSSNAALVVGLLITSSLFYPALAQSPSATEKSAAPTQSSSPVSSGSHDSGSPYRTAGTSDHERVFYQIKWGVDSMRVKAVESGQMIRFSYRVSNAEKAKPLNDKRVTPYLIDENARVKLIVPTLEKVGQLRQTSTPEGGKQYWMVFSNKERYVKPGHRVSVVIGKFRIDGLLVE